LLNEQKEHNETLAKLNFIVALTDCVTELAVTRGRVEKLVLLVRALQLLSSALSLATHQLRGGSLQPSSSVKNGKSSVQLIHIVTLSFNKQAYYQVIYVLK
jgi:serine/threonine-protein kinase ULK/ATG1